VCQGAAELGELTDYERAAGRRRGEGVVELRPVVSEADLLVEDDGGAPGAGEGRQLGCAIFTGPGTRVSDYGHSTPMTGDSRAASTTGSTSTRNPAPPSTAKASPLCSSTPAAATRSWSTPSTGSAGTYAKSLTSCRSWPSAASACARWPTRYRSTPPRRAWAGSRSCCWPCSPRWNAPSRRARRARPRRCRGRRAPRRPPDCPPGRPHRVGPATQSPGRKSREDRRQDRHPEDLAAPLPRDVRAGPRWQAVNGDRPVRVGFDSLGQRRRTAWWGCIETPTRLFCDSLWYPSWHPGSGR